MTDDMKVAFPYGSWDLDGNWYHNPILSLTEEEQALHNQLSGFTMKNYPVADGRPLRPDPPEPCALSNAELAEAIDYCCASLDCAPIANDLPQGAMHWVERDARPIMRHEKAKAMLEQHLELLLVVQRGRAGYLPMYTSGELPESHGEKK
jgi:hypothetical protein